MAASRADERMERWEGENRESFMSSAGVLMDRRRGGTVVDGLHLPRATERKDHKWPSRPITDILLLASNNGLIGTRKTEVPWDNLLS